MFDPPLHFNVGGGSPVLMCGDDNGTLVPTAFIVLAVGSLGA